MYKEQRTKEPSKDFWKVPKGYAKWLTVKQFGFSDAFSEISCFRINRFLMSIGITKVYSIVRKAGSQDIHVGSAEDPARLLRCPTFSDIPVTVEPHTTLNFSKGVVQSTEFRFVEAKEMVSIPSLVYKKLGQFSF